MFCKNCGSILNEGDQICSSCGEATNSATQNTSYINSDANDCKNIPTTSLLVFSIIELLCVNFIKGLIGLILYFVNLKPAIERGDKQSALKSKKTIKIVLWIGFALSLIFIIFAFAIAIILPMVATHNIINNEINSIDNLKSLESEFSSLEQYNPKYSYDFDYDY